MSASPIISNQRAIIDRRAYVEAITAAVNAAGGAAARPQIVELLRTAARKSRAALLRNLLQATIALRLSPS
jgi:hypothetical protein